MSIEQGLPDKPLGIIANVLESTGFEAGYVFEDLIFSNHNFFLLRMEPQPNRVSIFFNEESDVLLRQETTEKLKESGKSYQLDLHYGGTYRLNPDEENETLDIEFIEAHD